MDKRKQQLGDKKWHVYQQKMVNYILNIRPLISPGQSRTNSAFNYI